MYADKEDLVSYVFLTPPKFDYSAVTFAPSAVATAATLVGFEGLDGSTLFLLDQ